MTGMGSDPGWTEELEQLRRWKAEAISVLHAWDEVAAAVYAHRPPRLGTRHSANVMAFVQEAIAAEQEESL